MAINGGNERLASYDKDDDHDNDNVHHDNHGDADVDDNYQDHDTMTWWWRWCWGSLFCFDYGINGVDFKVWFESNQCNPFLFKHLEPSHIIHLKKWRKDTQNLNRITQWYEHFPKLNQIKEIQCPLHKFIISSDWSHSSPLLPLFGDREDHAFSECWGGQSNV